MRLAFRIFVVSIFVLALAVVGTLAKTNSTAMDNSRGSPTIATADLDDATDFSDTTVSTATPARDDLNTSPATTLDNTTFTTASTRRIPTPTAAVSVMNLTNTADINATTNYGVTTPAPTIANDANRYNTIDNLDATEKLADADLAWSSTARHRPRSRL